VASRAALHTVARYDLDAEDPRNRVPPGAAAWCIACGDPWQLVLRGGVFVCQDRLGCRIRIRDSRPSGRRRLRLAAG
jgi:hypothetical protein